MREAVASCLTAILLIATLRGETMTFRQIAASTTLMSLALLAQSQPLSDGRDAVRLGASQTKFGEGCKQVLSDNIIYDETRKLSGRFRVEQYYNWACHSDFQSFGAMKDSSVGLGIPIEGLPIPLNIGASMSDSQFKQSLSQWCTTSWASLNDAATYQEFSRVVDKAMVDAYKTCIEAAKEVLLKQVGAFAWSTPTDTYLRKYLVTIEFRPPIPTEKNRILSMEGPDVDCSYQGKALKFPFDVPVNTLAITCHKKVDDGRAVQFNTWPTNATLPVMLPGLESSRLIELEQLVRGLGQAISIARQSIDLLNARVDGIHIRSSDQFLVGEFGCGQQAISGEPFVFVQGVRDGTGCGIPNAVWGRRLELTVPPKKN